MPAYRSSAEADIRDAVVARIRECRPKSRIIHEINANFGGCRMDLIAVGESEIVAFEIKSAKDKLDRLPAQQAAMDACAHHAVVALHEKFLVEKTCNQWGAHALRDGQFFMRDIPDAVTQRFHHEVWVAPERRRALPEATYDPLSKWRFPAFRLETALPTAGLNLLWRDELYSLCGQLRVSVGPRARMHDMLQALRWHCKGSELTKGICQALLRRSCAEADPIQDLAEKVTA